MVPSDYRIPALSSLTSFVMEASEGRPQRRFRSSRGADPSAPEDWRARALCAHSDPELWFAVGALEHRLAKKMCRACPVRKECLAYAMDSYVDDGIWGGLTERERRWLRQRAGTGDWRALVSEPASVRPTRPGRRVPPGK